MVSKRQKAWNGVEKTYNFIINTARDIEPFVLWLIEHGFRLKRTDPVFLWMKDGVHGFREGVSTTYYIGVIIVLYPIWGAIKFVEKSILAVQYIAESLGYQEKTAWYSH